MRLELKARALLVMAGVLLVVCGWLLLDNQTVAISAGDFGDDGGPAGLVGCVIAPYDAGFNGNDEGPGGEHTAEFASEVAKDCYAANMQRFHLAIGLAGVIVLLAVTAGALSVRRRTSPDAPPVSVTPEG